MQLGDCHIFNQNGLILLKNEQQFRLTDVSKPNFGAALSEDNVVIVYENETGDLVKITEVSDCFTEKPFLLSRSRRFTGKEINLQIHNQESHLFFSSYYKGKKMILYYRENMPVRVFDFCDDAPFQTLVLKNGEILVVYQKGGNCGYSILSENHDSDFQALRVQNPIKLLDLGNEIYILAQEKDYLLYHFSTHKKIPLPLVFHKKPFIYHENGVIYLKYRHMHRHIYYQLTAHGAEFLKEVQY